MKAPHQHEKDLRRRLSNARARALFWSGNPSFTEKRFNPKSRNASERYELALCDIDSLATLLEEITGKRVKRSNPRYDFQNKFLKLMSKLP